MILFPVKYLKEVLIPETNKVLVDSPIDLQELLHQVGWLLALHVVLEWNFELS
jgi:hypothetical protein